jgi:hypothetical protein
VEIGPVPNQPEPSAAPWQLSVVAVEHADGSLTLCVVVPGAGQVRASAVATAPVAAPARSARADRGSSASRRRKKRTAKLELRSRTVATAQTSAAGPGLLELPLRISSPYTSLLSTPSGIYATVRVAFAGAGGPPLTRSVAVFLHSGAAVSGRKRSQAHTDGRKARRR